MNHQLLRTFVTVAEQLSFTEAAKILNLSQPAVSHHIQALEAYYNTPLFHRTYRQIRLTEAGMILYENALDLIRLHDKVAGCIQVTKTTTPIKVGCSNTIAEHFFPGMISEFHKEYPSFQPGQLQVTIGTSNEIADKLQNEEIDLALVEGKDDKYPFVKTIFTYDETVLVGAASLVSNLPAHSDLSELKEVNWLVRETTCTMRRATEQLWNCLQFTPDPNRTFEFHNNQMIKAGVIDGLGLAVISKASIQQELASHQLIILDYCAAPIQRPLIMMRKYQSFPTEWVRNLWDHVASIYSKVPLPQ